MAATCSLELLSELARWKFVRDQLAVNGASDQERTEHDTQEVSVFVTFTGSASSLDDSPLRVGYYDGAVVTGWIKLADVEAFLNFAGVERINLSARIATHIDRSMADIKVDSIRSKAPPYSSTSQAKAYTGKGVLVGVIDDSIWELHPSFCVPVLPVPSPGSNSRPIRKTRIIAIWDQIPKGQGRDKPPAGFSYGTFWSEQDINNILAQGAFGAIGLASTIDHGSHVTAIAAGNGALYDAGLAPFTLVGAAPEADIAFCNAAHADPTGSAAASDAMNMIFALAEERKQPCVVNMSFGTHEGARDGTADLELAIERALIGPDGPRPGRAVVVAAGNEADMRRHSRKFMLANGRRDFGLKEEFFTYPNGLTVKAKDPANRLLNYDRLYVWYQELAALDVRVIPPSGTPDPDWTSFGDIKISPKVCVVSGAPDPGNGKKYIVITFQAPMDLGNWRLEFRETAGVDTPMDVWGDRINDEYIYPRFVDGDAMADNTVTCPATAKSAIAVGNYICTPGPNEQYGALVSSSSRGLDSTYQVTADETRPHIAAPGRRIVSANNSSYADEADVVRIITQRFHTSLVLHALMTGTSQAAPHVTGVIALMFQKNPTLTAPQIRSILTKTANQSQIPIRGFPNRHWGYGKIDAAAALAAVP